MSFWNEHAERETAIKRAASDARGPFETPERCAECGLESTDVFFGSCPACFNAWEESCR